MSWLDIKSEKSEKEKNLDEALEEYREQFGSDYVFQFGLSDMTMDEVIEDIKDLIKSKTPQVLGGYEEGIDY